MHVQIVSNLYGALLHPLRQRGCDMYSNDFRVSVKSNTLYTYPDLVVVCGEINLDPDDDQTLLNPMSIIEVFSPSTCDYDSNGKFAFYRDVEILIEYVTVDSERRNIDRWVKAETWYLDKPTDPEQVQISGCPIEIKDVYRKIDFSALGRPKLAKLGSAT